jgi:hypothetical protein
MAQATPEGSIRIGLGHGGIHDFGTNAAEGPSGVIAPDRAAQAGLDYLALGDWHGQMRVTPNTWYSGTPEPDSFKHPHSGTALSVAIAAAGATAQVTSVLTGEIVWQRVALDLTPEDDCASLINSALPQVQARRDTLLHVEARGRLRVGQMQDLIRALMQVAPDFLDLTRDLEGVRLSHASADLDAIDPSGGALRQAAQALAASAEDPDLSAADRRVAATALSQLFSFVDEITQ